MEARAEESAASCHAAETGSGTPEDMPARAPVRAFPAGLAA